MTWDTVGIILGDNPAGRFCIKRLSSNEFFQISQFFGGNDIRQKGEIQTFGLQWVHQVPPLVIRPDLPIRKFLRRVRGLLTVMFLKRVCKSIFFQSNKCTGCKGKDGTEVANSLMVFNLLKIIDPFQDKKHLRA